jgi:hypothetical protein
MIEYKVKVYPDGGKEWFLDGDLHREDGPAVETSAGNKYWYFKGSCYTEEQFNKKINPKDCSGSTVVVDGVEYTLNKK